MAILLWGIPSGDDFTWDLTYKFHSEECITESTGYTTGFAKYSYPTRELKFSLGATGDDAYNRLAAFLNAGVTIVTTPLWFFRTSLLSSVSAGALELLVGDTSEFYVGEQALLMRANEPSVCELVTIESIAGSTLYISTPAVNDYSLSYWQNVYIEVLENSGFDSGMTGWKSEYGGELTVEVIEGSDVFAFKAVIPGNGQLDSDQTIDLIQGYTYELSFYAQDVYAFGASFYYGIFASGGEAIASENVTLSDQWVKYSLTFIPDQDYSGCEIRIGGGGAPEFVFYVDEVYLKYTDGSIVYDTTFAYIMPVISGVLDYEGLDFVSGLPGLGMKAKIDGGAWNAFTVPSMPSNFVFQSMDAKYNNPKILRDLCGTENGIISMYAHGDSSKLTFECTWNFCDSNWKTLRDIFFAARGKAQPFFIPTNMYELATTRGSDEGSTTIYLNPGYQYLYERFPYVMIYSRRTTNRFLVHVTDHVWRDEFTCDPLDHELYDGSRACIYPQVYFESDELTFSFKGINMCFVKATFIEDPS